MNPRAKKKARAISHGMGSPKAEKAAEKGRVLVRTEAPRPMRATAPRGRGWVMMPTMVARKMARSCQALRETPAGAGTSQRRTPVAIEAARGFRAAPCHGGLDGAAGTGAAAAPPDEAEARTTEIGRKAPQRDRRRGTDLGKGERREVKMGFWREGKEWSWGGLERRRQR